MVEYTSQYPPSQNDTYVKATDYLNTSFYPYFATDPLKSVIGSSTSNSWASGTGSNTNHRFHIDLGSAKKIKKLYYENYHSSGGASNVGVKNIIVQGSNESTAFAELTYATDTNWTNIATYSDEGLTTSKSTFDQHVAANQVDPKYLYLDNATEYRYYAIKFVDNYGYANYMGIRRVELQMVEEEQRKSGIIYY